MRFGDTLNNVDIREDIRDIKQKEKKNFDSFYLVEVLLEEFTMVDILKRNLRTETRLELLNVTIYSEESFA